MENRQAEHWKLFYDATKALFVLDDMLAECYNWYYQELFYIKLFCFLDESPNYIAKCKDEFKGSLLMTEWLQHVQNWRQELFAVLSENEITYIQYRRIRAAHMFQNRFEYDADDTIQKNNRIVCKEGGRKEFSRADVVTMIKAVETDYSQSDELDIALNRKIHPVLRKMRLDLNSIYNSFS